jgi:hypothetical protein
MFTLDLMVVPKGLVSLFSNHQMTLATQFSSLMDTTGRDVP